MAFSTKLIVLFAALLSQLTIFAHTCKHDEIEQSPEFLDVHEDTSSFEEGRSLASASYSNIRIYAHFDFLRQSCSSSYSSYIMNELVPPAIDYFESALKIKYPVIGNLVLSPTVNKICEYTAPPILRSVGVPADFFIYFDTEVDTDNQIATSKYCYLSSTTKRPLIGRTLINRNLMPIATNDVLAHERNMYTIMHEMMHALGFSNSLYKYFLDTNGRTRVNHIKTVKIAGLSRTVLDVPPLTQKLRTFYGCPSLQGAVLENDGGESTATSHFERKYFVYEAMSSGSIGGRRISEFSLALLEGSGWYVPDYSYAEPFFYGQGQGCAFVSGTCSSTSSQFEEFCTGESRGCAPHGRGGGYCSTDSIMDGCRYYYPTQDYDCENDDGVDFTRLPDLQVFGRGAGSKCFTGDLNNRESSSGNTRTSFCFKYTCSGDALAPQVNVQLGSTQVTCTEAGKKSVDGFHGSIDCPDPLTFCNTVGKQYCPRNCMGRGNCVNGKCECNTGFSGIDCALRG